MKTKVIDLNELKVLVKKLIQENVEVEKNDRINHSLDYVNKFYDKNKKIRKIGEPEIQTIGGDISVYQHISYNDKNEFNLHFYFSYLGDTREYVSIQLLDLNDYSLIKKIK